MNVLEQSLDDIPPLVPIKIIKKQNKILKDINSPSQSVLSQKQYKNKQKNDIIQPQVPISQKKMTINQSESQFKPIQKSSKIENTSFQPKSDKLDKKHIETNKSKSLISQLVNKISVKNISEELIPISSQNIHKIIKQIQIQKKQILERIQNYESQLFHNSNNKNIQKELDTQKINFQRIQTMKLLYIDKLELRNQIKTLNGTIEQLKKQNKQIKIKIAQGIKQVQAHIHNLPCEKQKIMSIQLKKLQSQLKIEKEMRIQLETKISQSTSSFQRLYEQADIARKIVVSQLKQIELMKNKKIDMYSNQKSDRSQQIASKKSKRLQQDINEEEQTKKKESFKRISKTSYQKLDQTPFSQSKTSKVIKQEEFHQEKRLEYQRSNLENEQKEGTSQMQNLIKKMRNNQNILTRTPRKRNDL